MASNRKRGYGAKSVRLAVRRAYKHRGGRKAIKSRTHR